MRIDRQEEDVIRVAGFEQVRRAILCLPTQNSGFPHYVKGVSDLCYVTVVYAVGINSFTALGIVLNKG